MHQKPFIEVPTGMAYGLEKLMQEHDQIQREAERVGAAIVHFIGDIARLNNANPDEYCYDRQKRVLLFTPRNTEPAVSSCQTE